MEKKRGGLFSGMGVKSKMKEEEGFFAGLGTKISGWFSSDKDTKQ